MRRLRPMPVAATIAAPGESNDNRPGHCVWAATRAEQKLYSTDGEAGLVPGRADWHISHWLRPFAENNKKKDKREEEVEVEVSIHTSSQPHRAGKAEENDGEGDV